MAKTGATAQYMPIFAGLFYAALAAGLVCGFVLPIFIDFNGWLLTANLALRALAPLAVLHAISQSNSPFSRRVWGLLFHRRAVRWSGVGLVQLCRLGAGFEHGAYHHATG
jgi:hypothetical protein